MKYFALFFIAYTSVICQNIYYQDSLRLSINGNIMALKYNDVYYNIYNGIVSKEGKYVAGTLIDKSLVGQIEDGLSGQMSASNMRKDSSTFILYSLIENKVLFSKKDVYLIKPYFTRDKLMLIENAKIEIYNLKNRNFEGVYSEKYTDIIAIKNDIYLIRQKDSTIIEKYDRNGKFHYFAGTTNTQTNILYIEGDRIIAYDSNNILIIEDGKVQKRIKFIITNHISNEYGLFLVGRNEKDENISLYVYNKKKKIFEKQFELEATIKSMNLYTLDISDVFTVGNEIYFINNVSALKLQNLISYDRITRKFKKLTQKGYIFGPIGLY